MYVCNMYVCVCMYVRTYVWMDGWIGNPVNSVNSKINVGSGWPDLIDISGHVLTGTVYAIL